MQEQQQPQETQRRLGRDLALYTLARLGLVAVFTAVLVLCGVPLLIALAVALVVALPAGLLLFRSLNARVNAGLGERAAARNAERARLRAQLRGETPADADPADTAPAE